MSREPSIADILRAAGTVKRSQPAHLTHLNGANQRELDQFILAQRILSGAYLTSTDLRGADLTRAYLYAAHMTSADRGFANVSGRTYVTRT